MTNVRWDPGWNSLLDFDRKLDRGLVEELTSLFFAEEVAVNPVHLDYCIIMGSRACEYRVKRGFELWKENQKIHFIVSGGNRMANGLTEAGFMSHFLEEKGVPACQIFLEEKSVCTRDNLIYSVGILGHLATKGNVGVVTAAFHRTRTFSLLMSLGIKCYLFQLIGAYGPNTSPDNWHQNPVGRVIVYDELKKMISCSPEACLMKKLP